MAIPADYEERVYAGVLGKLIGVYLGRPFEGWRHARIEEELGEIQYYVNDRLPHRPPLVVSDDDISGTFTFIRALEDHGLSLDLTAEQIGQTWLNYLIEERTILWWGGMGTSTEHTTFMRLKHGIPAPRSGSIELNGKVVAEQIGAQIFIDGWAMVAPGDPELAADLAARAGSVSHDGEAVYGAQALAAMEAAAFIQTDLEALMDIAVRTVPEDSTIARIYRDVREWRDADGDWRKTFRRIEERYGYDTYSGGCHMVPNHAVIVLALAYCDDDFQRALMIANTAGWDTDCNSGNVGCLMGIKGGLQGIDEGADWRGPVADRLYKISADGGDAVTDAVRETLRVCRMGRILAGETPGPGPKGGARYHFSLPGSVQGFQPEPSADCAGTSTVSNRGGRLHIALDRIGIGRPARVGTPVYIDPDTIRRGGYRMLASPSLYPGQQITADVTVDADSTGPVGTALYVQVFPDTPEGKPTVVSADPEAISPGEARTLTWEVPDLDGLPVVRAGVSCTSDTFVSGGLTIDRLDWSGVPSLPLLGSLSTNHHPPAGWTDGVDRLRVGRSDDEQGRVELIQNEGRGLLMTGTQDWADHSLSASVAPHLLGEGGIAVRVRGMQRYYALLLTPKAIRLVKVYDGETSVLDEKPFEPEIDRGYELGLTAKGNRLTAFLDGEQMFEAADDAIASGAVALVTVEGRSAFEDVVLRGEP